MAKDTIERFHFMEVMVKWHGRVNTTHLMTFFDISRPAASRTITRYMANCAQNLIYNESLKGFLATDNFEPQVSKGLFSEYQNISNTCLSKDIAFIEHIELPNREPCPKLVQPILRAISDKLAIDIGYLSLSNPDYLDRIIEPHSLVFDGLRYHVRAYCHKNQDYRDFVLTRFNGELSDEFKATHDANEDVLWQTKLQIVIMADPRLSPAQKRVIELDYQMRDSIATINTTAALLQYSLKLLRLDIHQNEAKAQQIVLTPESYKAISNYFTKPHT